jgi:hypothetical protein
MAGPVLTTLASIPWTTILRQAPALLAAAKGIEATLRPPRPPLRPDADIQALREHIAQLESTQEEHARLLAQLSEHVAQLATVADASLRLCRRALVLGGTGVAIAILACLLAWLL